MGFFGYGKSFPENWRDYLWGRNPGCLIVVAVIIMLLVLAIPFIPGKTTVFSPGQRESAWNACITYIEQEESVSASGAEAYTPAKVTLSGKVVYQVDIHYKSDNLFYMCIVVNTIDEDWQVQSLEMK